MIGPGIHPGGICGGFPFQGGVLLNVGSDIGSRMKKFKGFAGSVLVRKAAIGAALVTSFQPSSLRAELVYETQQDVEQVATEQENPAVRRESERGALEVSQAARDTGRGVIQQQTVYPAVQQDVAASSTPEVEHLSRSELLRRERLRQEMRNEDILQERLEELRLRDEKRREEELMGSKSVTVSDSVTQGLKAPVAPSAPVMQEEVLPGAPVSALESEVQVNPALNQQQAVAVVAPVSTPSAVTLGALEAESDAEKVAISVSPRGGLSTMSSVSGYNVQSRYSAGVDLGVAVSDHVSFAVGYSFNEYGVTLTSSNPWVYNLQYYTGTREALAMKQNVVDATLKLHLLGPDARLRPFIGGGAAWSKSFINYDQRIIDGLYQSGMTTLVRDYEVYSVLGSLAAGLDIRITKAISVGAQFEYFTVVTSRENQSLNNAAFYNYYGYQAAYSDMDKQVLGGSLARSGFYSVTGGLTFTF